MINSPVGMMGMFMIHPKNSAKFHINRDYLKRGDYRYPYWYDAPKGTVASRISSDPNFGNPLRRIAWVINARSGNIRQTQIGRRY